MGRAPRLIAILGTGSWRPWIGPFLEGPGYRVEAVDAPPGSATGFDAAVYFSQHDTLRRDLDHARALGVPAVVHPDPVVRLALDKRAMAQRALALGALHAIPDLTPAMAGDLLARGLVRSIVAKRPDGTAGHGMKIFRRPSDLATTGTRLYEGDYLLQPFIEGEEYSVNTAWHGGRCSVYPPVDKGSTRQRIHPHRRTRRCPAPLMEEPVWPRIVRACIDYMRPFAPSGFVEFEFIRRGEDFLLLEVNPRVSATLRLTAAAAATNPFSDLLAAAAGVWPLGRVVGARRHAMEWATPPELSPAAEAELRGERDLWLSTRITFAAADARALEQRAAWVRERAPSD